MNRVELATWAMAGALTTLVLAGGIMVDQQQAAHRRQVQSQQTRIRTLQAELARERDKLSTATRMLATQTHTIQDLRAMVDKQQRTIAASRGVGLWRIQPGPWETYTATWYAYGGINGNGITATGRRTQADWTAAVDPRVIPLGSVIEVRLPDGTEHILQALDTGGAIKGHRLDIYSPSVAECYRNGRQTVQVRILMRGDRR
jgi:3D (Asp-Asp-Asp) domain-containing protein